MSETAVVVLPSPDFVGVIAVTQTSFASGRELRRSSTERLIFALYCPSADLARLEPGGGRDLADRAKGRGLRDLQ